MKTTIKKALVTGGAGFIGSHIAEALLAEECEVNILDNLSSGHLSNLSHIKDRITFFEGDIRDAERVNQAMQGCDLVFHEAAMVSVPETVEKPILSAQINDIGTLRILESARQNGVRRVVLASSSAIYGDDPAIPKTEDMPPRMLSPYAVQKQGKEYYARLYQELYGLETVCLRYFNVYGPRQDPSSAYSGVISIFMTRAEEKQAPLIYGDGGQSRDFIFVKDVAKANLLAATVPEAAGKAFNIGIGSAVTINRLWEIITKMVGIDVKPEYNPPRPGDIRESLSSIDLAAKVLGFSPDYTFEKGLEITLDWYRQETRS